MGVSVNVDFSYVRPFGCRPITQLVQLCCGLPDVCVQLGDTVRINWFY
jgi:hypothetical protein